MSRLKTTLLLLMACVKLSWTFTPTAITISTNRRSMTTVTTKPTELYYTFYGNSDEPDYDTQVLRHRLSEMRRTVMEEEYKMPPNPRLSPSDFVTEILEALWDNSEPRPDSGFRCLLRASTGRWRRKLYDSIGAPTIATEEQVASALGEAMSRPHNQFAILVGEAEKYSINFPSEPLDYSDGTCWLECRLRDRMDNRLLVVTGWQLEQRKSDGAWLVDGIDWQDFRDEYRPGIGREEWMRICG